MRLPKTQGFETFSMSIVVSVTDTGCEHHSPHML